MHAHTLRNIFLGTQGSLLFLFWFLGWIVLTILLGCLITYSWLVQLLSWNQWQRQHFLTQNCFSQEVLEPHFSTVSIICETGNDLQADLKNSVHQDSKEISFEEKIKEWHTDPQKTSAGPRMTAVVGDKELQKRKASWMPQNTPTNTWEVHIWFEWAKEKESNNLNQIISETIPPDWIPRFFI